MSARGRRRSWVLSRRAAFARPRSLLVEGRNAPDPMRGGTTMQTHRPAPMTPTRTPGLGRWPAVAGLGLALALAFAIGVARLGSGDAARTAELTAVPDA